MKPQETAAKLKQDLLDGTEPLARAAQCQEDLDCWEDFLVNFKPASLLELGTGTGVMSEFLRPYVSHFITVDSVRPAPGFTRRMSEFFQADIFGEGREFVEKTIVHMPRPLVLYCDNGDKPREVREFSPFLRAGDYLAVHDFMIEIMDTDIPARFEWFYRDGLTAIFRLI